MLKLIYASLHNSRTGDMEVIVRVPEGASANRVLDAVHQVYPHHDDHLNYRGGRMLSDSEAESLLEMKVCSFVDFSHPSGWQALEPEQGWRDEQGNEIEVDYAALCAEAETDAGQ